MKRTVEADPRILPVSSLLRPSGVPTVASQTSFIETKANNELGTSCYGQKLLKLSGHGSKALGSFHEFQDIFSFFSLYLLHVLKYKGLLYCLQPF